MAYFFLFNSFFFFLLFSFLSFISIVFVFVFIFLLLSHSLPSYLTCLLFSTSFPLTHCLFCPLSCFPLCFLPLLRLLFSVSITLSSITVIFLPIFLFLYVCPSISTHSFVSLSPHPPVSLSIFLFVFLLLYICLSLSRCSSFSSCLYTLPSHLSLSSPLSLSARLSTCFYLYTVPLHLSLATPVRAKDN